MSRRGWNRCLAIVAIALSITLVPVHAVQAAKTDQTDKVGSVTPENLKPLSSEPQRKAALDIPTGDFRNAPPLGGAQPKRDPDVGKARFKPGQSALISRNDTTAADG